MTEDEQSHEQNIEELANKADDLNNSIVELSQRIAASRRWNVVLAAIVAGLAVVTLALVAVIVGVYHANQKVERSLRENYTTQQEQMVTRVRVLCPLYTVVLSSASPAVRAALPPDRQKAYDLELKVIRDGYAALGCQPPLK